VDKIATRGNLPPGPLSYGLDNVCENMPWKYPVAQQNIESSKMPLHSAELHLVSMCTGRTDFDVTTGRLQNQDCF